MKQEKTPVDAPKFGKNTTEPNALGFGAQMSTVSIGTKNRKKPTLRTQKTMGAIKHNESAESDHILHDVPDSEAMTANRALKKINRRISFDDDKPSTQGAKSSSSHWSPQAKEEINKLVVKHNQALTGKMDARFDKVEEMLRRLEDRLETKTEEAFDKCSQSIALIAKKLQVSQGASSGGSASGGGAPSKLQLRAMQALDQRRKSFANPPGIERSTSQDSLNSNAQKKDNDSRSGKRRKSLAATEASRLTTSGSSSQCAESAPANSNSDISFSRSPDKKTSLSRTTTRHHTDTGSTGNASSLVGLIGGFGPDSPRPNSDSNAAEDMAKRRSWANPSSGSNPTSPKVCVSPPKTDGSGDEPIDEVPQEVKQRSLRRSLQVEVTTEQRQRRPSFSQPHPNPVDNDGPKAEGEDFFTL